MVPGEQSTLTCRTKRVGKKETVGTWEGGGRCEGWMWWWQRLLVDCASPLRTASGDIDCNEEVPTANVLSIMGSISLALLPCSYMLARYLVLQARKGKWCTGMKKYEKVSS